MRSMTNAVRVAVTLLIVAVILAFLLFAVYSAFLQPQKPPIP
jgi:hypothetical protein